MTVDELRSQIQRERPDLTIDCIGSLIRGKGVEAVCSDGRGKQGLWPSAWREGDVEVVQPLKAVPSSPGVQRTLF